MFDYCAKIELGLPHRLFCVAKSRVVSEGNGWICHYGSDVRVIDRVAFPADPSSGSADASGTTRSAQAAARAEAREFREAFGNIPNLGDLADEDSTDTDEMSVVDRDEVDLRSFGGDFSLFTQENELDQVEEISAVDSADKIVPKIRIPKDDRVVMMGKLSEAVDFGRYVPTVGTNTGQITLWWRKSEKNERWEKYTRAIEIMRKKYRNAKTILKTSNSYSINIHRNFDTIVTKAVRWQQWHSSWVYGFRNYMQV